MEYFQLRRSTAPENILERYRLSTRLARETERDYPALFILPKRINT